MVKCKWGVGVVVSVLGLMLATSVFASIYCEHRTSAQQSKDFHPFVKVALIGDSSIKMPVNIMYSQFLTAHQGHSPLCEASYYNQVSSGDGPVDGFYGTKNPPSGSGLVLSEFITSVNGGSVHLLCNINLGPYELSIGQQVVMLIHSDGNNHYSCKRV